MHFFLWGVNTALSVHFYQFFKEWDWLNLEKTHLSNSSKYGDKWINAWIILHVKWNVSTSKHIFFKNIFCSLNLFWVLKWKEKNLYIHHDHQLSSRNSQLCLYIFVWSKMLLLQTLVSTLLQLNRWSKNKKNSLKWWQQQQHWCLKLFAVDVISLYTLSIVLQIFSAYPCCFDVLAALINRGVRLFLFWVICWERSWCFFLCQLEAHGDVDGREVVRGTNSSQLHSNSLLSQGIGVLRELRDPNIGG